MDGRIVAEIGERYRSSFASKVAGLGPWDIVEQVTFDNAAPKFTAEKAYSLLKYIQRRLLKRTFEGDGFEVGGGCGFFCALLAREPRVRRVYSVEACAPIVEQLMPGILEAFAEGNKQKVVGCIGDFSNLQFPEGSLDFAFDFYSLHHSADLAETLREIRRVLKPGGYLLCLDKARSDALGKDDLDRLLDTEYSAKAKTNMGLDPSVRLTRRMNGEHEYRLKDWKEDFLAAGFSRLEYWHLAKSVSGNPFLAAIKKAMSYMPIWLQLWLTGRLARSGNANNLETSRQVIAREVDDFPKEISVLVAWV